MDRVRKPGRKSRTSLRSSLFRRRGASLSRLAIGEPRCGLLRGRSCCKRNGRGHGCRCADREGHRGTAVLPRRGFRDPRPPPLRPRRRSRAPCDPFPGIPATPAPLCRHAPQPGPPPHPTPGGPAAPLDHGRVEAVLGRLWVFEARPAGAGRVTSMEAAICKAGNVARFATPGAGHVFRVDRQRHPGQLWIHGCQLHGPASHDIQRCRRSGTGDRRLVRQRRLGAGNSGWSNRRLVHFLRPDPALPVAALSGQVALPRQVRFSRPTGSSFIPTIRLWAGAGSGPDPLDPPAA